jgi:hypothetical protein
MLQVDGEPFELNLNPETQYANPKPRQGGVNDKCKPKNL